MIKCTIWHGVLGQTMVSDTWHEYTAEIQIKRASIGDLCYWTMNDMSTSPDASFPTLGHWLPKENNAKQRCGRPNLNSWISNGNMEKTGTWHELEIKESRYHAHDMTEPAIMNHEIDKMTWAWCEIECLIRRLQTSLTLWYLWHDMSKQYIDY